MRFRSFFMLLLGVSISGGSVFLAKEYLATQATASVNESSGLVSVIVARVDVPFGHVIESQMLTTQSWPAEAVPANVFTSFETLLGSTGAAPRRAKRHISQGEILLHSKVSKFGEKVTIVQTLAPNTRAMAIKVDAVTAVGGFVTPGDRVDIVMTHGKGNDMRAVTILQNIKVIGVDQVADENQDQPEVARTITVEVTAIQGQKLALAQKAGSLSMTLRGLDDDADEPLDMVDLRDLLLDKSPRPEDEQRKPTIRVRRGNKVEIVELN